VFSKSERGRKLKSRDQEIFGVKTRASCVRLCAISAAIAWMACAIVEFGISCILPWFLDPDYVYILPFAGFTAILFFLYVVTGAVFGSLLGIGVHTMANRIKFLRNADPKTFFAAIGATTLVSAFGINLIVASDFTFGLLLVVSTCLLLIVSMVASAGPSRWAGTLPFITNPWTCCVLILGLSAILLEILPARDYKALKFGVSLVYVFLVLVSSLILQRIIRVLFGRGSIMRSFTLTATALLVIVCSGFFFKQMPLRDASNLKPDPLESDNPNVILIVMDTVRADHLSVHGYPRDTTPNLRKFAEVATIYNRAISSSPFTLPTHASIFTGMSSRSHGANYRNSPLGQKLDEKIGMGVVANYAALGRDYGLDRGFEYYINPRVVPFVGNARPYLLKQRIRNFMAKFASFPQLERKLARASEVNEHVFSLLAGQLTDNKNFFLFINYMDAHWPYIPPPPFNQLYPGMVEDFDTNRYRKLAKQVNDLEVKLTTEEYDHLVSQYDGGIAYMDFHIGKLLEELKRTGHYENSLILITSDHGEVFGDRSLLGHGSSVYQDQVLVPLVVKYPNTRESKIVDEIVHSIDILPTVLGELGYDIPDHLPQRFPLRDKRRKLHYVISESLRTDKSPRFNREERAVFSGQYKFISSTAGKRELYNLQIDPKEKTNLHGPNVRKSKDLEVILRLWLNETEEHSGSATKLDKEAIERLKSLGYIN
jgi:arylsulfatase A-like enzyme